MNRRRYYPDDGVMHPDQAESLRADIRRSGLALDVIAAEADLEEVALDAFIAGDRRMLKRTSVRVAAAMRALGYDCSGVNRTTG